MNPKHNHPGALVGISILLLAGVALPIGSGQSGEVISSYGPINEDTTFDQIKAARLAVKAERAQEHLKLLNARYDLSKKTSSENLMSGGKPLPAGPTARLPGTSFNLIQQLHLTAPEKQDLTAFLRAL